VFTRDGFGEWTQQGSKLVGSGATVNANQGTSVSLSADGNTAIAGGLRDNSGIGAAWIYTRINGIWHQLGNKLVGSGAVGAANQGQSVALSADGGTALVGGPNDNFVGGQPSDNPYVGPYVGATWVFAPYRPLQITPVGFATASGTCGGPFSASFNYTVRATSGSLNYSIIDVPSWLTASSTSGTVTTRSAKTITFTVNSSADNLLPGTSFAFPTINTSQGNMTLLLELIVKPSPKLFKVTVNASPHADGTVTGGGTFIGGTSDTATATAKGGFHFVRWTESGTVISSSPSDMFTVPCKDITLVADFQKN
jgi:Divergent InlB B-repeat domain